MTRKRTEPDSPATLSLVGAQQDSAKQKRLDALARGREKSAANRRSRGKRAESARAAGVLSPLERYRAGDYPVWAWDDEEVVKGRPANIGGGFDGPGPSLTARQSAEIKRELLKRGQSRIDSLYVKAIEALADIAENGENEGARAKAADLLIQRVAGKVPDRIEIRSSDPWQDILDEIMDDEVLERVTPSEPHAG